jgi:hypothetical protein
MFEDPIPPRVAARAAGVLVALFVAVAGLLGYSIHQRTMVNQLSAENAQTASLLRDTRAQIAGVTAKLDSITSQQPVAVPTIAHTTVQPAARKRAASRRAGDPRFKHLQNQLDAQGRQIESTRQDLASTRTELQGSIARTHEELVVLQKKGERNYIEFDLDKSKQFTRTGPVGISLRKANTKHMYADLELMVEDAQLSKKHVNLFEPVVLYPSDQRQPVQLVINAIQKNHIHGYISAPRYTAAELAASAAAAQDAADSKQDQDNPALKPRQKLDTPR